MIPCLKSPDQGRKHDSYCSIGGFYFLHIQFFHVIKKRYCCWFPILIFLLWNICNILINEFIQLWLNVFIICIGWKKLHVFSKWVASRFSCLLKWLICLLLCIAVGTKHCYIVHNHFSCRLAFHIKDISMVFRAVLMLDLFIFLLRCLWLAWIWSHVDMSYNLELFAYLVDKEQTTACSTSLSVHSFLGAINNVIFFWF